MNDHNNQRVRNIVESVYRTESRRVLATLIRLLGDFDSAEEALHDAFALAVEQWSRDGMPDNPRAWLVSAGRFKAIDSLRRRSTFGESQAQLAGRQDDVAEFNAARADEEIEDDRLGLIFTCCHAAIDPLVQVAITLREVGELTTEEIASAFLVAPATMAQRIVRGKAKIRDAGIPYVIPSATDFPERLDSVLTVIYLVFNEGYSASSGNSVTRGDLTGEAIRLGRLICELLPDAEAFGLLALMLLHESRRSARTADNGDIVLLEDQDRSLWNRELIGEAVSLIHRARFGTSRGLHNSSGDLGRSCGVIDRSRHRLTANRRVVRPRLSGGVLIGRRTHRAVAVAMRDGPEAGLELIDSILARSNLGDYHLAHAARADLCRRLGRKDEARRAYRRALSSTGRLPRRRSWSPVTGCGKLSRGSRRSSG